MFRSDKPGDELLFSRQKDDAEALTLIRKESLDIYNRLHSIEEDAAFVRKVHEAYSNFPLIPNLRCGAWYTDPKISSSHAAYFKSTDGHFANWGFSLRRPNLHLLPVIMEKSGIVLVDSTRSGKRIPDALSKTVPIWCAVVNRAVALKNTRAGNGNGWDIELYTPRSSVSGQEHGQIASRLDGWAQLLAKSSYELPLLEFPLRPLWITPSSSGFPNMFDSDRTWLPVICVSASRQVEQGTDRRSDGFVYVQGSGDDHELWGMGLTPAMFWAHKSRLLSTTRSELSGLVQRLGSVSIASHGSESITPIARVGGRLSLCSLSDIPFPLSQPGHLTAYIIVCPSVACADSLVPSTPVGANSRFVLKLVLAPGKGGQLCLLQKVLPRSVEFSGAQLSEQRNIVVACETGNDASVGIALGILQEYFDDDGKYVYLPESSGKVPGKWSAYDILYTTDL